MRIAILCMAVLSISGFGQLTEEELLSLKEQPSHGAQDVRSPRPVAEPSEPKSVFSSYEGNYKYLLPYHLTRGSVQSGRHNANPQLALTTKGKMGQYPAFEFSIGNTRNRVYEPSWKFLLVEAGFAHSLEDAKAVCETLAPAGSFSVPGPVEYMNMLVAEESLIPAYLDQTKEYKRVFGTTKYAWVNNGEYSAIELPHDLYTRIPVSEFKFVKLKNEITQMKNRLTVPNIDIEKGELIEKLSMLEVLQDKLMSIDSVVSANRSRFEAERKKWFKGRDLSDAEYRLNSGIEESKKLRNDIQKLKRQLNYPSVERYLAAVERDNEDLLNIQERGIPVFCISSIVPVK